MSLPDIERYRVHVARIDLPQAQKDDMIRIVWRILEDGIDRAFGAHPVQRCKAESQQIYLAQEVEHATDRV